MTATLKNVVSNTQLNFVQELLNPEVVFSNIIAVPDEIGLGCYWPKYIHPAQQGY